MFEFNKNPIEVVNKEKKSIENLNEKKGSYREIKPMEGMTYEKALEYENRYWSKSETNNNLNSGSETNEIKGKQYSELTDKQKREIKDETGWSIDIINYIRDLKQYKIYRDAGLIEADIAGRKCLIKEDLDLDYRSPKTIDDNHPEGISNRELMQEGKSPYDAKTGEKIELHHMGQEYDSPLAELCENSEHGDGNDTILHDKATESFKRDKILKDQYNNIDRPMHWKERSRI